MRSLHRFVGVLAVALLVEASAAQAAPVPDAPAVKIDKYLPDGTGGVFVIDVKQILASKTFTKDLRKQIGELLKLEQVQMVLKDTGFDAFSDIDRIVFATSSTGGLPFLVIEGRFDTEKIEAKATELVKRFPTIKAFEVGKVKAYEADFGTPEPGYVALVDKGAFVFATSKEDLNETVEKAGGKRKTEFKSKALAKLIAKMDPKLAINVACAGEMVAGGSVTSNGMGGVVRMTRSLDDEGIVSITGGVAVGEDIKGKIHFTAKDVDIAKKLAAEFEAGLAAGREAITREAERDKELAPFVDIIKTITLSINEQTFTVEGQGTATAVWESLRASWLRWQKLSDGPGRVAPDDK